MSQLSLFSWFISWDGDDHFNYFGGHIGYGSAVQHVARGPHAARGLILNGPPELTKVLQFEY